MFACFLAMSMTGRFCFEDAERCGFSEIWNCDGCFSADFILFASALSDEIQSIAPTS